jgi:hypothetical protein
MNETNTGRYRVVPRWLITALVVVLILIIVGVAYDQGLFDNLKGSTLGMILAGLAAPYLALKNFITGDRFRKEFRQKYDRMDLEEKEHRMEYDTKIAEKEKRIAELDKEIELLDAKLEVLELKKQKVEQSVKVLTIDETKREVQNFFGD